MQTEADARKWSDSTFLQLAEVFAFIGHSEREIGLDTEPLDDGHFKMFYGFDQPAGALSPAQLASPAADDISQRMLSVQVRKLPQSFQNDTINVEGALRFSLAWVPEEHGGKGLLISVGGSTFRFGVDTGGVWTAQADATFDAPFSIQLGGKTDNFQIGSPNADPKFHVGATLASKPMPPGERRFRFLSFGGDNGFDIGRIALSGTLAPEDRARTAHLLRLPPRARRVIVRRFHRLDAADEADERRVHLRCRRIVARRHVHDRRSAVRGRARRRTAAHRRHSSALTSDTASGSAAASGQRISQRARRGDGPARQRYSAGDSDRQERRSGASAEGAAQSRSRHGRAGAEDADSSRAVLQHQIGPVVATIDRIGMKFGLDFPDDRSKANLHFANLDWASFRRRASALRSMRRASRAAAFCSTTKASISTPA